MKTYDVAVIGAGPAGGIAATLCARSGLKTILVEKKKLPRAKTCAGGLTARCVHLLRDISCLNDQWLLRTVNRLMIHYPQTGASCELLSSKPYLCTVNRPDFDGAMVELAAVAGAEIRQAESFVSYQLNLNGRIGITTDRSDFSAKVLIGADGYHSRVRKQMVREAGLSISNPMMFGIACDVPMNQVSSLSPDHCHLFFNVEKGINYGWAFPKKDVFNAGLVLNAGNRAKAFKPSNPLDLLKFFVRKISGKNILCGRVGAAPIPLFAPSRNSMIQKDNVLLAGDAAGFADAWTGEGIYYAVRSAVLAHRVIQKALDGENPIECLSMYSKLCKKHICSELDMSYRVSELFTRFPSLYDYLQYPGVRQLFVPHTQGKIRYPKALVKAFFLVSGYKLGLLK